MNDVAHAVIGVEASEPTPENLMQAWCVADEVRVGERGVGPAAMRLRDVAMRFAVAPGEARSYELRFDQR